MNRFSLLLRPSVQSMLARPISTSSVSFTAANTSADTSEHPKYETLAVSRPVDRVLQVELNRPNKRNAMNSAFWREFRECFQRIALDQNTNAVIVTGAGTMFTAGLDLQEASSTLFSLEAEDTARKAFILRKTIADYQETFSAIEKCPKPVIAAVHSACVGGGVDLIAACDIRICSADAWFQIKEVDIGLAADVGTLQRLPKIVGNDSLVRELSYTARKFLAQEAKDMGFVSQILSDQNALRERALNLAQEIASKSPVAVQGTKHNLVYSRDHSVAESLEYMVNWNMAMLQTNDLIEAVTSAIEKRPPVFSKL